MSTFYTVRLKRKVLVSVHSGRKIEQVERFIEETYRDLPYSTAKMYAERFPEADVKIERQYGESGGTPEVRVAGERSSASRGTRAERKAANKAKHAAAPTPRSAPAPAVSAIEKAASGPLDYAELVTTLSRDAA